MTERRPPPSLGTYRPTQDDPRQSARDDRGGNPAHRHDPSGYRDETDPAENLWQDPAHLPRIVTSRVVTSRARPPDYTSAIPPPPQTSRRVPPPPIPSEPEGMSGLRMMAYCLFGLFAFVAAAAVAAFLLIPTGLIRDRLQTEVRARTGRDLVIAGPTTLSLWPRPSVSVKDVTLSSPPDMGAHPLLKVAEVEVAVRLLPLLLHDVSIDQLLLRRPEFNLSIDAKGRRSWDFADAATPGPIRLAQVSAPGQGGIPKDLQDFVKGSTDATARAANKSRIGDISLGNVSVIDGSVRYRDARVGVDETVSALNVQASLANIASPLDLDSDFTWRNEPVKVRGQISPFRALLEGRPIQAQIKTSAAPLNIGFDGVMTLGAADVDLDGRLTAQATAFDKLAKWTGRPMPSTLPGGFSLDAKIKQTSALTALSDAQISIGGLTGSGTLSVDNRPARPYIKGALRFATLDLNLLQTIADTSALPAGAATSARAAPAASGLPAPAAAQVPKSIEELLNADTPPSSAVMPAARKPQVRGYTRREGWSDETIDLAALGLADADVRLGFETVVWRDLKTGAGQLTIALKSKAARITLDDLQLYDGRARGVVTLDGNGAEATVGTNVVMDGVSALPFFKAFSDFDWLAGKTHLAIAVAGRGATERQIISTLNGKADIAIADGALIGFNLPQIIANFSRGKFAGLERVTTEKTDFTEFAASTQIVNGLARNDDLRMTNAQGRTTGAGTIALPQRTMDYVLKPKLTSGAISGLEVPIKITGSIDKPTVTPELAGINGGQAVKAIQDAANSPAGRDVQETIKGALNGDPDAKAKVKGFLDQFLKK